MSWKTHVCHDKTFVATKMILVPAPTNDGGGAAPTNDRGGAAPTNDRGGAAPTNDRGAAHNYGLFQVQRYRLELK